jgi:hypothetical protein
MIDDLSFVSFRFPAAIVKYAETMATLHGITVEEVIFDAVNVRWFIEKQEMAGNRFLLENTDKKIVAVLFPERQTK